MSEFNDSLRILKILVESTGGRIEPFSDILHKSHGEAMSENELSQIEHLRNIAFNGFFHCAANGIIFTDIIKIKEFYGHTVQEIHPGASPTFMKLSMTYWTFKVLLNEIVLYNRRKPDSSVCIGLLQSIDIDFAGVFFPTPGLFGPSRKKREQAMRTLIAMSGADLDVEDYIWGNFYLR